MRRTENTEQDVLLLLCDISGYTRFMTAHKEELAHGHVIVTELIKSVLKHLRLPLTVAKLEGDAVFFYVHRQKDEVGRKLAAQRLGETLVHIFADFKERRRELEEATLCTCGACKNVNLLRLKIVMHRGKVLFQQIGKFSELSGVDVILAHRLLKNSVPMEEYLLVTEVAQPEIALWKGADPMSGEETYQDLGTVKIISCPPPASEVLAQYIGQRPHSYATFRYKMKDIFNKILRSRLMWLHLLQRPTFRNLPAWGAKESTVEISDADTR